jgi:hypothetical protein
MAAEASAESRGPEPAAAVELTPSRSVASTVVPVESPARERSAADSRPVEAVARLPARRPQAGHPVRPAGTVPVDPAQAALTSDHQMRSRPAAGRPVGRSTRSRADLAAAARPRAGRTTRGARPRAGRTTRAARRRAGRTTRAARPRAARTTRSAHRMAGRTTCPGRPRSDRPSRAGRPADRDRRRRRRGHQRGHRGGRRRRREAGAGCGWARAPRPTRALGRPGAGSGDRPGRAGSRHPGRCRPGGTAPTSFVASWWSHRARHGTGPGMRCMPKLTCMSKAAVSHQTGSGHTDTPVGGGTGPGCLVEKCSDEDVSCDSASS